MTRPSDKPRAERLARLTEQYGEQMARDMLDAADRLGEPRVKSPKRAEVEARAADAASSPSYAPETAAATFEARVRLIGRRAQRDVGLAFEAYRQSVA